jgi:DnaJ family protein B protein 12
MFDAGPQFVFNLGGGPGFRVHQFGGNRPRRRPAGTGGDEQPASTGMSLLTSLVPILLLFVLPLLSSLFSSSGPSGPTYRFDAAVPPHTQLRTTPNLKINYYINPNEVAEYNPRKLHQLDQTAERDYVATLRNECEAQRRLQERMVQDAQGWFFPDAEKMQQARALELRSCKRLEELGSRQTYY